MTDIVKELRQGSLSNDDYRWKAADEIERLREEARTDRGFYGGSLIRLEMENAKLRAALKPFANALKGNWSYQSDEMPIDAGFGASDLRLRFRLGDFRAARDVLGGDL